METEALILGPQWDIELYVTEKFTGQTLVHVHSVGAYVSPLFMPV